MNKTSGIKSFNNNTSSDKNLMSWENEGGGLLNSVDPCTDSRMKLLSSNLWGEETNNSLTYFNIGNDIFDNEFIKALLIIKKSMAISNSKFERIDKNISDAIVEAADLFLQSRDYSSFPVKIWQTGSGTQINMNVNEVLANVATIILKENGSTGIVHPYNHVNLSQSSNDVIPSALNIATTNQVVNELLPILKYLEDELFEKEKKFKNIIKSGRTHLMDAVPLTLGQEFSAFRSQINQNIQRIEDSLLRLKEIPLGGTAVGTGINCPSEVAKFSTELLSHEYRIVFKRRENLFSGVCASDEIVALSGQLKTLCCSLLKIATDIIILSSGPDTGVGELNLPNNEAGSSIMPGKVNPTQCESLSMVCCQVIGNDMAVTLGGMQGKLQLNTFRPLLIRNILHSLKILSDSVKSFTLNCLVGINPNIANIENHNLKNKMIITKISPIIGYEKATDIVNNANRNNTSVKEELRNSGLMNEVELENIMNLSSYITPPSV